MTNEIIPKIKKQISSFLSEERGSISKQSVLSMGALLSTIAAASLLSKDSEAISITLSSSSDEITAKITASHSHHSSHANHSSHSSGFG